MAKKKQKKKERSAKSRLLRFLLAMLGLGIAMMLILILTVYIGVFGKIPSEEEIGSIRQDNASLVYASDGTLMGKYYNINRQSIRNDHLSPFVRQALIATEDNRFFEHKGIDLISLGRVLFKSLLMGDFDQGGGSTISQQLAKNLYPRKDFGFMSLPVSKIREMFIASRLEDIYSKEDILTMYLNTVTFGENVYGIEAAAWRFFSKTSQDLNISEAATLVGMLAANTAYNPRLYPERALGRRNTVFTRMHTQGFITAGQLEDYLDDPLVIDYKLLDKNRGIAPYFRHYLRRQIVEILDDSIHLETDGLRIYTTINNDVQTYAEESIAIHMRKLQKEFDQHWAGREPWDEDPEIFDRALQKIDAYRKRAAKGTPREEILKELSKTKKTGILTIEGEELLNISTIDSLKHYMRMLNTGFLALDPATGAILGWVGGINYQYLPYDHVVSKRQAGSTFKPFVYAAALENGMRPCQYILNEQSVYEDYDDWSPGNSNGEYGGYYSLAGGLMNSLNTISAEVMIRTGPDKVVEMAGRMGVRSELPEVPSLALGTADVSLLEMVTAYAGFAKYGKNIQPHGIERIEDAEGNIIYEREHIEDSTLAISEELASMMNYMLQRVVDHGTAASARSVYGVVSPLAGKTGTTQDNADGWFIGYTPNFVAGAWVGAELPAIHFRTTALGSGSHMALPICARTVKKMESDPELSKTYLTNFPALSDSLIAVLDCPPTSRNLPAEYLSRKEIRELKQDRRIHEMKERDDTVEKRGFFRKIGDFFRKKR